MCKYRSLITCISQNIIILLLINCDSHQVAIQIHRDNGCSEARKSMETSWKIRHFLTMSFSLRASRYVCWVLIPEKNGFHYATLNGFQKYLEPLLLVKVNRNWEGEHQKKLQNEYFCSVMIFSRQS